MRATDHEVQTTAAPSVPGALRGLLVVALLTGLGAKSWRSRSPQPRVT
jgi:hypothetical protein